MTRLDGDKTMTRSNMRQFFKIFEKAVWALVIIAIIIVLVLLATGIITNYDIAANYVSSFLPYFYLVAVVFVIFKASICGLKIYLESKIEKETIRLQNIIDSQREQQVAHEEKVTGKLDILINDIASFPRTPTADFAIYLNENLHSTVLSLANQMLMKRKPDRCYKSQYRSCHKLLNIRPSNDCKCHSLHP